MKPKAPEALRLFARPEPGRMGYLIYGEDAMRVALKRQELVANLVGPHGEDEMRLTRLQAGELRKDPAALADALKAQSFFPGPRAVHVEDATEALAKQILPALSDWAEGDATLVVTASLLKPTSSLRKGFEAHRNAYAIAIYDDPPSRAELEAEFARAGLTRIDPEAMTDLVGLSRMLDPGDFRQTVEKLSLYKLSDPTPVGPADVAAVAPASTEAETDDAIHAAAEGRPADLGPLIARLAAQGVTPVSLCITATRHFRALHAAASHPDGPSQGIARLRPPVNFKLRDPMIRQARAWGVHRLETALELLIDTDLTLRSSSKAPQMALIERALIRLAHMPRT